MLRNKKFIERRIMWRDKQVVCALALFALIVYGCATPAYKDVFKDKPAYNSKSFAVNRDLLYQATLRAICARNFIIEKDDQEKGFILARRSFQRGKRTIILVLQASVNFDAAEKAVLYLNALETTERHYVSDRTRFFLWLIPLPGGGGKEGASVKEGERVIEDETFYENFLVEIEAEAKKLMQAGILRQDEKEISAVVQVPEAETSAVKKITQEVISQDIPPQIVSSEVVANETTTRNNLSQENISQEIPAGEETLPIKGNTTDLPESGMF